ncbi:MAG: cell wall-binding repeat-containing protein [Euzebya sp.]
MRAVVALAIVTVLVIALAGPVAGEAIAGVRPGVEQPVLRRIAGPDRAATAAAVAADAWTTAEQVVLADGEDPVGALIGAHLAARLDVPILLGGPSPVAVTQQAIAELGPQRLILIGAVQVEVPAGTDTVRLQADTPGRLAVAALELEPGSPLAPVVVVSQDTFADALSAANLAPARILLTSPADLDPATAQWLGESTPSEVIVLGGTAAVSDTVAHQIGEVGGSVRRIAGLTRYDTAVTATTGRDVVVIASGQSFADAVAFVAWAARSDADLVVTTHDELPAVVTSHLSASAYRQVVVAGGTAAVGNFVDRQTLAALTGGPPPGAVRTIRPLDDTELADMTGVSWHQGCPVDLDDLRVVETSYWRFDGNVADDGQLIVAASVATDISAVMGGLFDARFPLEQVRPVREYAGDDDASTAANNSSAFNCRFVAGTTTFSQHSYGTAIDLNPVRNPFVQGTTVSPPAGQDYLDRTDVRPGMIVRPGPVTTAFSEIGWGWGADFLSSDDYQHFSQNGH